VSARLIDSAVMFNRTGCLALELVTVLDTGGGGSGAESSGISKAYNKINTRSGIAATFSL